MGARIDLTHIDVREAGEGTPAQRWVPITHTVDRLTAAGATVVESFAGHHVYMADPEGNEFCVA